MKFTYGCTKIRRGNTVNHIAIPTESAGYCGAKLDTFYETEGSPSLLKRVCKKCLAAMPKAGNL